MNATQKRQAARQPFEFSTLVEFCGTKKLATRLAVDMGDALEEADRARDKGDSDDSAFEMMFWDGTLFLGDDEMFDEGITADTVIEFTEAKAYDEKLDATLSLCDVDDRKMIVVRYEFKEDDYALSAWWLTRKN